MYVPIIQFPDQLLYHLRLNVHSVFGLGADGERAGSKTITSIRSGMLTLDYLEYPVEIMEEFVMIINFHLNCNSTQ